MQKHSKKNNLKSNKKIMYSLFVLLCVFVVAGVFMIIEASTKGTKLVQLEKDFEALTLENKSLNQRLVSETSLVDLSKSTESLGFTKPSQILYISKEDVVASR